MNSILSAIQQERGLASWLKSGLWRRGFDRGSLSRAEARMEGDRKTIIFEDAHHFPGRSLLIEATAFGADGRSFQVHIGFLAHQDTWRIRTDCTCPNGLSCEHCAAVALTILKDFFPQGIVKSVASPQEAINPELNAWLAQLAITAHAATNSPAQGGTPIAKPKPESRFLAFCLTPLSHSSRQSWRFEMRLARHLRDGKFEITNTQAQADPSRPPLYMTREDFIPASLYHQRFRKHSLWQEMRLVDGDWEDLLEAAHASGRFYQLRPRDHSWIPVHLGPAVEVEASWENLADGRARPTLSGLPAGAIILPTKPIRYLDDETGTIGLLRGDLSDNLLFAWTSAPEIPPTQMEAVVQRLNRVAPMLPQPGSLATETRPRSVPLPHLTVLSSKFLIEGSEEEWIHGRVHFTYGDSPPLPACGPRCPPVHIEVQGEKRIRWHRDPAAEIIAEAELHQLDLAPMENFFPAESLDAHTRRAVVVEDPIPSDHAAWLDIHASGLFDELRKKGWIVEIHPSARLTVHEVTDFFPEIEADTAHGIDWFRFEVTTEVNGKRISLIPHIANAIRDGYLEALPYEESVLTPQTGRQEMEDGNFDDDDAWDDDEDEDDIFQPWNDHRPQEPARLPKYFLLPCDRPEDGVIRFPSDRFIEICRQVAHLFQGHSGYGPLRLDRLAAADAAAALDLAATATARDLAELAKRLNDLTALPPVEVPPTVRADLRPYQTDGFRWLQFLARNRLHGILADDMGLGKTLQTLTHLAAEHQTAPGRPSLVVAPTSVVPNWAAEAARFTPHLKVLTLHGKNRAEHFDDIPAADIVLTSYPLLSRDIAAFESHDWHTLVLDEAQYIKNPKSIVAQSACKLKSAHRVCLSGTPMENHLGELWSLMRFLMPGFLGDEKSFNAHVRRPIERQKSSDAQLALNRRVAPLILRRTKDQVATELPEKTIIVHHVDLTARQTDLYESVRAAMDKRVRQAIAERGLAKSHIIVLDALLKLRQICCHPQLLSIPAAANVTESAKTSFLTDELLPTLMEEKRRVLLFSSFTSMLDRIERHLIDQRIPYLKLTGQTTERASLVARFQQGDIPIFLISLKAGGTGLNLTAADTVIHYDPWWNPAAENQATDRAHRIGQTKPVFVHKLVCRGTIEDRILELQQHKAALVEALLADDTAKLRIDPETLSHLLSPLD